MTRLTLQAQISEDAVGKRLDLVLAELFPDYSRSRIQLWIKNESVTINGRLVTRPREKIQGNECVVINAELDAVVKWQGQDIAIDIVHEDDAIIIVNKAAGMVVHPAAGNWDGTLVNALLHHHPKLEQLPRAGIVHRLDKDTTGLMVVAKTLEAHNHLVNALQKRNVSRQYLACINGSITAGGTVDQPIARHPVRRKQMAVISNGKRAITHYRIEERFSHYSLLRVKLETGRTHQIRVHMAWLKHPLTGDPVYGGRLRLPPTASEVLVRTIKGFQRQALHATELGLIHPASRQPVSWHAPLPADMGYLLNVLRNEKAKDS